MGLWSDFFDVTIDLGPDPMRPYDGKSRMVYVVDKNCIWRKRIKPAAGSEVEIAESVVEPAPPSPLPLPSLAIDEDKVIVKLAPPKCIDVVTQTEVCTCPFIMPVPPKAPPQPSKKEKSKVPTGRPQQGNKGGNQIEVSKSQKKKFKAVQESSSEQENSGDEEEDPKSKGKAKAQQSKAAKAKQSKDANAKQSGPKGKQKKNPQPMHDSPSEQENSSDEEENPKSKAKGKENKAHQSKDVKVKQSKDVNAKQSDPQGKQKNQRPDQAKKAPQRQKPLRMPRYSDPRFDVADSSSTVSDLSYVDEDFLHELAYKPPASYTSGLKEPVFHGTSADLKDYLEWKRELDSIRRSVKRAEQKAKARDEYDREMARQEADRVASREAKERAATQKADKKAVKDWLYERWKAQGQAGADWTKDMEASRHGQAAAGEDPGDEASSARKADEQRVAKWMQERARNRQFSKTASPRSDTNSEISGKRVSWAQPEASFMIPPQKRPRATHPYDYESDSDSGSTNSSRHDRVPPYRRPRPDGVSVVDRDPDYVSKNHHKWSGDGPSEPIFVVRPKSEKYAKGGKEPIFVMKPSSSKGERKQQSDWQNTHKYQPKSQPVAQDKTSRTEANQPLSDWNQSNWQNEATRPPPTQTEARPSSQNSGNWNQSNWQNAAPDVQPQNANNNGWTGGNWQDMNWADSQPRNKYHDDVDRCGWQNFDPSVNQPWRNNGDDWNRGPFQNSASNRNQGYWQNLPEPNRQSWSDNDNNWNRSHRQNSPQPNSPSWNDNDDTNWSRGHWQNSPQPDTQFRGQDPRDWNRADRQRSGWPDSQPERTYRNDGFRSGWQNTDNRPSGQPRPRSRNRGYEMSGALGDWGGHFEPNSARRVHYRPPSVENVEEDDQWAGVEW
jgi:hypothetical protein